METANGTASHWETDSPVGAALLLVIGEPVTDDHKNLILGEVTKGFRCWNVEQTGIDINDELARIANRADTGEEGPNGERTIQHKSERCAVEILVNPRMQTVNQAINNFLMIPSTNKHLIYAGHYFSGSGSWVLQDDSFSLSDFAKVCKDSDIENAVKQNGGNLVISCQAGGDWSATKVGKLDISKNMSVSFNPAESLDSVHGVLQFTAYVGNFVKAKTIQELMKTSDVVGNIRFSKPTLYIFPACEGDSALFGISGFNLLINGGYSRKSCFWDLARHLDRIDAVLMTHLGTDNIFGMNSVLKRKSMETVHPEIGFMFLNATDKATSFTDSNSDKEPTLDINLAEEGSKIIEFAKNVGPSPQSCLRAGTTAQLQPINLYHKVGHGSLDMYILNPVSDSKELKDFYTQWNKQVSDFGSAQNVPLPNMLSICSLLVWQPSDPLEKISRIFFPGNAPQHKVIEGLEKLKHLEFLKRPSCSAMDLKAKPVTKKAGASGRPGSSKPIAKSNGTDARKMDNKTTKAPLKTNKISKEDENKKKAEDKASKAKPAAAKPPTKLKSEVTSPRKQPGGASSAKKSSPTEAKKKSPSPTKPTPTQPEKAETEVMKPSPPEVKSPSPEISPPTIPPQEEIGAPVLADLGVPAAQNSLIDITPEEPNKSVSDILVPTQDEGNSATQASESPDPLPDPNSYDNAPVNQGEGSLMYGSFHQDLQDDIMAPQNGNDFNYTGTDFMDQPETIQPESLPEPVAYPPQEPDLIPDMGQMYKESQSSLDDMSPQRSTPPEPDVIAATESALAYTPHEEIQNAFAGKEEIQNAYEEKDEIQQDAFEEKDEIQQDAFEEKDEIQQNTFEEKQEIQNAFEDKQQADTEGSATESALAYTPLEEDLQMTSVDSLEVCIGEKQEMPEDNESNEDVIESSEPEEEQAQDDVGDQFVKEEQDLIKQAPEPVPAEFSARSPDLEEPQPLQDDEEEFSPDEADSQGDIRELKENKGDVSPYAFENKGFRQDTEISQDEAIGDEASTEPVEDMDSDEGHCVDAFEKDEDNKKESVAEEEPALMSGNALQEEAEEKQDIEEDTPREAEPQCQNGDYLEASNIPEAFEKDETPDPTELASTQMEDSSPDVDEPVTSSPEDREEVDSEEDSESRDVSSEEQVAEQAMYHNGGFNSFIGLESNPQSLNPFEGMEQTSSQQSTELSPENPFLNTEQMLSHHGGNNKKEQEDEAGDGEQAQKMKEFDPFAADEPEGQSQQFDPEAEWGRPLGLPSPPPPEEPTESVKQNGKASPMKSKSGPTRASETRKSTETSKSLSKSKTLTEKKSSTTTTKTDSKAKTTVTTKSRPASAAVTSSEPKAKMTKRPATATGNRSSPATTKLPPLPPMTPFYMDLSYIPSHGDPAYSDMEFFKRVRARYYVLSSLSPNSQTLNALLDAKQTWDDKDLKVTIIPTYDNDTLRHWMGLHKEKLCELNVDVAPSASRCTIQLQDHETSCSAYRLEF